MIRQITLPDGSTVDHLALPLGAAKWVIRGDGRIEALCSHGVGHCVAAYGPWQSWMGVHGCDGCCASFHPQPKLPNP